MREQGKATRLGEIAFARSGDKGNSGNVAVFARSPEFYPVLKRLLTEERVAEYFSPLKPGGGRPV